MLSARVAKDAASNKHGKAHREFDKCQKALDSAKAKLEQQTDMLEKAKAKEVAARSLYQSTFSGRNEETREPLGPTPGTPGREVPLDAGRAGERDDPMGFDRSQPEDEDVFRFDLDEEEIVHGLPPELADERAAARRHIEEATMSAKRATAAREDFSANVKKYRAPKTEDRSPSVDRAGTHTFCSG